MIQDFPLECPVILSSSAGPSSDNHARFCAPAIIMRGSARAYVYLSNVNLIHIRRYVQTIVVHLMTVFRFIMDFLCCLA